MRILRNANDVHDLFLSLAEANERGVREYSSYKGALKSLSTEELIAKMRTIPGNDFEETLKLYTSPLLEKGKEIRWEDWGSAKGIIYADVIVISQMCPDY